MILEVRSNDWDPMKGTNKRVGSLCTCDSCINCKLNVVVATFELKHNTCMSYPTFQP